MNRQVFIVSDGGETRTYTEVDDVIVWLIGRENVTIECRRETAQDAAPEA